MSGWCSEPSLITTTNICANALAGPPLAVPSSMTITQILAPAGRAPAVTSSLADGSVSRVIRDGHVGNGFREQTLRSVFIPRSCLNTKLSRFKHILLKSKWDVKVHTGFKTSLFFHECCSPMVGSGTELGPGTLVGKGRASKYTGRLSKNHRNL
jgi:hypothetical protein